MNEEIVIHKYAMAFLNLYANKIDEKVFTNIYRTHSFLNYHPEVIFFLSTPNLNDSERSEIIDKFLIKFCLIVEFKKLIILLIDQNRITLLKDVLKSIWNLYQEKTQYMEFNISSATEMKNDDLEVIKQFLTNKTGKKIIYKYKVDKELIAGICVKSNIYLWEYSIRKQLNNAQKLIA